MSGSGPSEKAAGVLETISKLSSPANHRPLLVGLHSLLVESEWYFVKVRLNQSSPLQASVALLIALQLTGVSPLVFFSVKYNNILIYLYCFLLHWTHHRTVLEKTHKLTNDNVFQQQYWSIDDFIQIQPEFTFSWTLIFFLRFFRLAGASTSPSLCSIIVATITLVTVVLVVLLAKNISRRFSDFQMFSN